MSVSNCCVESHCLEGCHTNTHTYTQTQTQKRIHRSVAKEQKLETAKVLLHFTRERERLHEKLTSSFGFHRVPHIAVEVIVAGEQQSSGS